MLRRWRVKRAGSTYRLNVPAEERELLRSLFAQLRELIAEPPDSTDERIRRLYPTAYPDDPERDAEYRKYMHEELVASRLAALDLVDESLGASELSEAQMMGWMRSINSVRLVLGTLLDVSEEDDIGSLDPEDPETPHFALYGYLSALLEEVVSALS